MANKNVRVGVTTFSIDGSAMDTVGDMEYSFNTIKREGLVGMDGPHGVKEVPVLSKFSVTVRDGSGLSVADFQAMSSANIEAQLGNGKQIVGTGCWTTDVQTVSVSEGTIKLEFETASLVEIGG